MIDLVFFGLIGSVVFTWLAMGLVIWRVKKAEMMIYEVIIALNTLDKDLAELQKRK